LYSRNNSRLVVVAKRITEDGGADAAKTHPEATARANALIKRLCANYDNGICLALDDGEPCACVQSIYTHFSASIPQSCFCRQSFAGSGHSGTRFEKCVSCGTPIIKKGNRKKYCEKCAQRAYKAQQAEYARRKRQSRKIGAEKPAISRLFSSRTLRGKVFIPLPLVFNLGRLVRPERRVQC
jgi:hypothetical protein